jgi:RHS repeat-associated protein
MGIDLLKVEQKNGAVYDLISSATYNTQHRPLTYTDASGQSSTFTYNAQGQVATVTTPARAGITEDRTTTYTYDASGFLQSVIGPLNSTVSFTYDGYQRPRTITDPTGYVLTYDYDALDRETKITHPDGTYEQVVFDRLDPVQRRDRLGRWTHTFYDALRRPVAIRDPLGRTMTQQWCNCGSLDKVIDGENGAVSWDRDLQGRVTKETRTDNSFVQYVYENTTSRLKQRIDRKNQTKNFEYFLDDQLKQASYTNAQNQTPSVSYTYDPAYERIVTMSDGTGTTTFGYNSVTAPPSLGAGRLATISGPVGSSTYTTTFEYDEPGRIVSRTIGSRALVDSLDALGRISSETNPLGTFTYGYIGTTSQTATVAYPNAQTTTFAYFDNLGDNRLQELKYLDSASAILSKQNYTYYADGNIRTWSQQAGANPAKVFTLAYDNARELTSAVVSGPNPLPVPSRFAYAYDKAGNRIAEQLDDTVTSSSYNGLEELASTQAGGALLFGGTVSEPATVSIGGKPAQVGADNVFRGTATVSSGTSNVAIAATDASGNTRTNTYQVSQAGASKTLTYDLNGNLISDGTRALSWDAENRLVSITIGTKQSLFTYDGLDRRVAIVEKDGGAITSEKRFVWCGSRPCEERDASGSTVTKAFYAQGIVDAGVKYFQTVDHLGSAREITDLNGVVQARYDYDPFGRMTKVSGTYEAAFGFTGHYFHAPSGLSLPLYRAYDAGLGRWTSEDPLGLIDGPNRYAYVRNNPANLIDLTGESAMSALACLARAIILGATAGGAAGAAAGAAGGATVALPTGGLSIPTGAAAGAAAGMSAGANAGAAAGILICVVPPVIEYCRTRRKPKTPKGPCSCVCYKAGTGPDAIGQQPSPYRCQEACSAKGYPGYRCGGGDVIWE